MERRAPLRWVQQIARSQRGSLLVETLIALAVFGILGTAVVRGVQIGYVAKGQFEALWTADTLIRGQNEYVMQQSYQPPGNAYPTITPPPGYALTVQTLVYDETSTDVETVRITVLHQGQVLRVFDMLRANR